MKTTTLSLVLGVTVLMGCDGFGPRTGTTLMSDAGVMPMGDAGSMPRPRSDAGMELPREVDSGPPLGEVPSSGDPCDPDRDRGELYDCALEGCDSAYLVCASAGEWRCFPEAGTICVMPDPETDAGVPPVRTDAGSPVTETDAGVITTPDAGRAETCGADTVQICTRSCGVLGYRSCNTATGRYEGDCLELAGLACPATPTDAGTPDAGTDAGVDAGSDAGTDAGPSGPMHTVTLSFRVDSALLYSTSSQEMFEEMALRDATRADARPLACDSGSGLFTDTASVTWYRCIVTRRVGTELFFSGSFLTRYNADYGSRDRDNWSTMSAWNPGGSNCGDLAATRGVTWSIVEGAPGSTYAGAGRSLLPATGIPEIVQPRNITEAGYKVCRGRLLF